VKDQIGAVVRFGLGVAVAVAVYVGSRAIDLPVWAAVLLALLALYLYGAASTNGYLPFTKRWHARRTA
jgi:hypothetical protein